MGEVVGHLVTQITQFGVTLGAPEVHPGHPTLPWGFPEGIVWGGLRVQHPQAGSDFVPRCAGIPELLFLRNGRALHPLAAPVPGGMLSKVQVLAGFEPGAPSVQARGDDIPKEFKLFL